MTTTTVARAVKRDNFHRGKIQKYETGPVYFCHFSSTLLRVRRSIFIVSLTGYARIFARRAV